MPQIRLEYTTNIDLKIDFKSLFTQLHQLVCDITGANLNACKSGVIPLQQYCIGDGADAHAFAFITINLLSGRSTDEKQTLSQKALALLRQYYEPAQSKHKLQLTVRVNDMDKATYSK